MSRLYLDTGVLLKLYVVEPGSDEVQRLASTAENLPLNPLQVTELRNALHACHGRKRFKQNALKNTIRNLEEDIAAGVFAMESPAWSLVFHRAQEMAGLWTSQLFCRTLDILHVALAEQSDSDCLVTGDKRQHALCKKIGMDAVLIENE